MHAIRSLLVLAAAATAAAAQAPKTTPAAAVTVRVVSVPDAAVPKLAGTVAQQVQALEAVRGSATMQMPRLTVDAAEPAEVIVGERVAVLAAADQSGGIKGEWPKTESVLDGVALKVAAAVSDDRKAVTLTLDARFTVVNHAAPLVAVTRMVPADGAGQAVPFTQFYRKPDVQTLTHKLEEKLPTGGGKVVELGTVEVTTYRDAMPDAVARIPYVNRLFKKKPTTEKRRVFLVPTVEVVELPAATDHVAAYRKAVADGRLADAKAEAERALAADPAAFAK
jgi:type II secretory pathway component GspD/PulD (secretin)